MPEQDTESSATKAAPAAVNLSMRCRVARSWVCHMLAYVGSGFKLIFQLSQLVLYQICIIFPIKAGRLQTGPL